MEGLALLLDKQEATAEAEAAEAADLPAPNAQKRVLWCDMTSDDSDYDDEGEKGVNLLGVHQELAAAQSLVCVLSSENEKLNARVLDLERDRDALVEMPKAPENQERTVDLTTTPGTASTPVAPSPLLQPGAASVPKAPGRSSAATTAL